VLNSGRSLLTLLNDILDLSKIEAGRFQLDLTGINPVQLLQETRSLFSGAAKNKGLRLNCQCHPDLAPMYQTDGHRLRQMLANLVGNAIKFTLSGHVLIEAQELQHDDTSALLEFSVTDSGIGIAADKQASLFEAFSQIDSSTTREFGGSGLGLSIVSQLARLLGGDVGVQSEPGKGSRFWFRVRAGLRQADASSQLLSAPLHQTGKIASPQLKGLVLVAEDNAVNCMVIEGLLQTLGLTVQLVDNGQQAVDRLLQGPPPDVVLMDLHMPVMDGYTATERIRQTERDKLRPRVPIIALTADAFENDHQHCLAVGMDGFLTKPVTLEDLRAALARCLPGVVPDAAEASSPGPVPEPDWPHLQKLLDETQELLSRQKFDAIESFAALQSAAGATTLGSHLNEVAPLITSLRFEEALARLRQLRALC